MYQGTSELFNEKIKASSRTFRARLVNTSDSTDVIEKGFRKLTIAQISNEDKRSLSIGGITASELNVEIDNLSGVITGKEFDVQIGLLLDDEQNTYEWVTIGKFTAQKPTIKNNVTSFTAFDRFVSKLGGLYVSRLTYPASGKAILNEIATMSGVVINTDGLTDIMFPQKTVINSSGENVSANPFDGFTYRETIGYVAMAYGKFATVNRNGEVDLRWYTDTNYRIEKNMSYDDISVADTEYSVEYLNVTVNNDRNNPLIKGEGLTGISVGTPIFTTEMLNHAYGQVSGFKYIPTTLSFKGDPRIDLGDIVTVVKYDNTEVKVPVMSLDFDFDGGLICNIGSYGDTEQSEKAYATSPNANKYDRMYTDLLLLNQAIANKVTAEYVEAHYVATSKLDAVQAEITQAVIRDLETEFLTVDTADIRYANIELTNIEVANVGRLLADVGLVTDMVIVDGHVTGVLDSVTINANNITSGTLTTDRLVIRGTDKSIVYELNNISGALQAKKVDTLNGEIVTPRTINADRIIANSITSGELNVNEIFANSAIIKKIFSENVEATGTITGATLKGAYAEITNGNIGGWYISSNSLYTKKNIGDDIRLAFLQVPDSLSSWVFSVQSEDLQGNRNGLWYVTANGNQTMKGSLTVGSNVSIGGHISVPTISGDTNVNGDLSVINDVIVGGQLSVNNGLTVNNNGSQAITISNPNSKDLVGMYFFNKLGYLGNIYMETVGGGLYRDGHLILDDTNYSNYAVPKTGGTFTGAVNVSSPNYPPMTVTRSGVPYSAAIRFVNSNGTLGAIGMSDKGDELLRWSPDEQTIHTVLDTGNYSDYAVPKTGGKITGGLTVTDGFYSTGEQTVLYQDYYCFNTTQGAGSNGYWKLCTITITGTYADSVIEFDITHRNNLGKLYVSFSGTTDVSAYKVSVFKQTGGLKQCYIVKTSGTSSGSVFDIYVEKEVPWGNLTVTHMKFPNYMRGLMTLTWSGAYVSSVPSGATPAQVGNDWTSYGSASGTSTSVVLNAGSSYLFTVSTTSSMEAAFMALAKTNGAFNLVKLYAAGTMNASLSGTTLTISAGASTTINYKYIELK